MSSPGEMFLFLTAMPPGQSSLFEKVAMPLAVAAASYLLGSLCFAIIFTRIIEGKDIRELGSKNAGTANVLRSAGPVPGALTGVFDFAKGVLAVYIGYWLFERVGFDRYSGGCFASLFALTGHLYPVFFRFRGGKGVMTMAGIVAVLNWRLFLVLMAFYMVMLIVVRIASVASLAAFAALPFTNAVMCAMNEQPWLHSSVFFAFVSALIFFTHRTNIQRLKNHQEKRFAIRTAGEQKK